MALDDILVTVGADISGYMRGLERATDATRSFEQNISKSSGALKKNTDAINNQGVNLSQADKAYADYNRSVQQQGVDLAAADKAMAEYEKGVQEAREELEAIGRASLVFGAALGKAAAMTTVALAGVMYVASSFEDAMIGVKKTVDGTPEQFNALEAEIRGLSKELPRSADEIAGVATEAGRLGIERENISKFSKTMIQMGDSSDLSASKAAQSMARFMNIMGTSVDEVDKLGSAITHMGNNAAASESEILEMSRRIAGASNQVGITEGEVIGLAASMAELGIRAEAGGTAMQKTILTINTAVMEGGEKLETFAGVAGMTAEEFKEAFEDDASSALVEFLSGLDEVSESGGDVASVLKDVSLNNERTMDTLLRLSSSHKELAKNMDISTTAYNEGTALAEEAGKVYESLSSRVKILFNRFKDMALIIGKPLMEAFKTILDVIEPFVVVIERLVGWFGSLSEGTQKTIAMFALLTPAVLGLLAVIALLNGAWTVLTARMGVTAGASGILSGAMGLLQLAIGGVGVAIKALSGPFGWIVAGLGAIAAGVTYFIGKIFQASEAEKEFAKETDELTASTESLNEELGNSSSAHSDVMTGIRSSAKAHQSLADEVIKLSQVENKTAEEKAALASQIEGLNEKVLGLGLAYDEQTDSLNLSSEKIKDRISLMESEEKLTAAQERMVEISEDRNKADMKLEEINRHRKKLNELTDEHGKVSGDTKDKLAELDEQEEALKETHADLGMEYEVVNDIMVESQEAVTQAIIDGVKKQTLAYDDLSDTQQNLVDELTDDYQTIKESATDMFNKIADEAEQSVDEMIEALEHNIKATQQWADNLNKLADEGADHLVEHFREAGPQHAAELQAILDGGEDKIEKLEKLLGEGAEAAADSMTSGLEVSEEVNEILAQIVTSADKTFKEQWEEGNFDQYSAEAIKAAEEAIAEREKPMADATERLVNFGIISPFKDAGLYELMRGYGTDTMDGLSDGLEGKKDDVTNVMEDTSSLLDDTYSKYFEINSPSRLFYRHGQDTFQGLIDGLSDNKGAVLGVLGDTLSEMKSDTERGFDGIDRQAGAGVGVIGRTIGKLPGNTDNSFASMLSKMRAKGTTQVQYMKQLSSDLTKPFNGIGGVMTGIGGNAMAGLRQGLINSSGSVMAQARGIASSVSTTISSALQVRSPSRVLMRIGEFAGEGLEVGLLKSITAIERVADDIAIAATPEQPKLEGFDISGLRSQSRQVSARLQANVVTGDYEVHGTDNRLLSEIRDELRNQRQMIVELDGRMVGELVEPVVTERQKFDDEFRRRNTGGEFRY